MRTRLSGPVAATPSQSQPRIFTPAATMLGTKAITDAAMLAAASVMDIGSAVSIVTCRL